MSRSIPVSRRSVVIAAVACAALILAFFSQPPYIWHRVDPVADRWVAIGTIVLALATYGLARATQMSVASARQEVQLQTTALDSSTRPLLVDVPPDTFILERQYEGPALRSIDSGPAPTYEHDRGRIAISAGTYIDGPSDDAHGYVSVRIPVRNIGPGVALLVAASIDFPSVGGDAWETRWSPAALPTGEIATLVYERELDPGDAAALEAELRRPTEKMELKASVSYMSVARGHATTTWLAISGQGKRWSVDSVQALAANAAMPMFKVSLTSRFTDTWGGPAMDDMDP